MRTSLLLVSSLVFLCALSGSTARAQDSTAAKKILGEWLTAEGTSKIEIYKEGEEYCGRISWLKEPERDGKPRVDDKNPDEKLRSRPLIGLVILRGFSFDGEDQWTGGKIYDPKSGNDYSAKMTLKDDHTLNLRGYVLMPLFGRTETWTR
ncbi:MAG TPA: DUF2147 domain-containing protein [Bacteroidota bacterium]|nr:DUF2147 domain-containing protein [Bacteroidota bacterium]